MHASGYFKKKVLLLRCSLNSTNWLLTFFAALEHPSSEHSSRPSGTSETTSMTIRGCHVEFCYTTSRYPGQRRAYRNSQNRGSKAVIDALEDNLPIVVSIRLKFDRIVVARLRRWMPVL